ncbi:DEAD/DEAH box helicase family protein [Geomonas subterranea]|uniref:DEAD/DEAH box helicase family protein n=1 Tax=Geomonas subterranea TaxID=2847989 RepID=UPI001CD534F7|nr:DEAD/DEAH box helicase family protein [Geomonas fuzhouensis]
MFLSEKILETCTWQHFERVVSRLLAHEGYDGIRVVGQSADKGADVIAHRYGKRWLFQVKHWRARVGLAVLDQTVEAMRMYRAEIPVIVSLNGFEQGCYPHQQELMSRKIPMQLWDKRVLMERASRLSDFPPVLYTPRKYQEDAIRQIIMAYEEGHVRDAMVVMATGLGKTLTAAEAVRRISLRRPVKLLVLAHTNPIVFQLERAFWSFMSFRQSTIVWNGQEKPTDDELNSADCTFACINTFSVYVEKGVDLPQYDIVIIDECHHAGASMYLKAVAALKTAGNNPFILGLTATPWRPDTNDLDHIFRPPLVTVDMVMGLTNGYLSQIDYRMHVDNINWESLVKLKGALFSPRHINRSLFITEWDDSVVYELQKVYREMPNPRALVFCGTIDHAIIMRDKINSLGFCYAAAIYSGTRGGKVMGSFERNRILCDFHDGTVNVICAVDIFNEGVDVPDVNIIVFQRVTHSRRIFVQQLGRGLRVSQGKEAVVVLDFVSDIRRFAAGLELKEGLEKGAEFQGPVRVKLNNKVVFKRVNGEDLESEKFLKLWLDDVAAIESSDQDKYVLKFPPKLPGSRP